MWANEVKAYIDAAHWLPGYDGKCGRVHGHRWEIVVAVNSDNLKDGMVVDFKIIKDVISKLDHQGLNAIIKNPTTENLRKYIYDELKREFKTRELDVEIVGVTVFESPECSSTYWEMD